MIIGSFDCGWGLPTLICVLLVALKYMEVCIFLFLFGFRGVLMVESMDAPSLAKILGDFLSCCYVFMLPVETVFMLLVETVSVCCH